MHDDPTRLKDDPATSGGVSIQLGTSIREAEKRLILTTLAVCDGRRAAAADRLGMSLGELYRRLGEYGYTKVDPEE